MKSPRDKQFYEYKDGTPMLVEDLIEALRSAISVMARQQYVSKILNVDHKRKLEVLEKIKESYELAIKMSTKPKLKPVKGRRR